ncbi:MAG: hypothetical protein ABJI69_09140 [Balneola sp.]
MSELKLHIKLNEQDKADLARYKKLYKDTGDHIWRNAVKWFENGKERIANPRYIRAFKNARGILITLNHQGKSMREISEHMDGVVSADTVARILRSECTLTIATLNKIIDWQLEKFNDTNQNSKAS